MEENINNPPQPNWQDITFADIDVLRQAGKLREAITLAQLRLRGISSAPTEIEAARDKAKIITDTTWNETKRALVEEINQLESIIAQLQSEL